MNTKHNELFKRYTVQRTSIPKVIRPFITMGSEFHVELPWIFGDQTIVNAHALSSKAVDPIFTRSDVYFFKHFLSRKRG